MATGIVAVIVIVVVIVVVAVGGKKAGNGVTTSVPGTRVEQSVPTTSTAPEGQQPGATTSPAPEGQQPAKIEGKVGEPVEAGDLSITVYGWKTSEGDGANKPGAGNQFIVVDVGVDNIGKDTEPFSSNMQLSIRTPDGSKYDRISYTPEPRMPEGDMEMQVGQKLRGLVAFEVPGDVGPMSFFLEPLLMEPPVEVKLQ